MSTPLTARTNLKMWLAGYTSHPVGLPDAVNHAQGHPLLASDVRVLVDAFDSPCGSCHPCLNYADETWRAAGRKPPHVYQWDEAQKRLKALRELQAYCRTEADNRENVNGERSAYDDTATKLAEILADQS